MIQNLIDEIIEYISSSGREEDVAKAKKEYFSQSGGIFGEEVTYDMRIGTFLEWYIIDRRIGGKSVLEDFVENVDDATKRAEIFKLREGVRSIFEVASVSGDKIKLKDLYGGKKYVVMVPEEGKHFQSKSLLETRVFPEDKKYVISHSHILHPAKMKKFIVSKLKDAAAMDDIGNSINILANMSLRWERFNKYRIEEIYK